MALIALIALRPMHGMAVPVNGWRRQMKVVLDLSTPSTDDTIVKVPFPEDQFLGSPLAVDQNWILGDGDVHSVLLIDIRNEAVHVLNGHKEFITSGVMSVAENVSAKAYGSRYAQFRELMMKWGFSGTQLLLMNDALREVGLEITERKSE